MRHVLQSSAEQTIPEIKERLKSEALHIYEEDIATKVKMNLW